MTIAAEFRRFMETHDVPVPGDFGERTIFGDLIAGDATDLDLLLTEPALHIETDDRVFVVHRLGARIRYYAGPNRKRSRVDDEPSEIGRVGRVEDAVLLACSFLRGMPLALIEVARELE